MLREVEDIKELLWSYIGNVVQCGPEYTNLYNIYVWVGHVSVPLFCCIYSVCFKHQL